MSRTDRRITACIPYYGCGKYVRRAVDSLLAQTHRDLTVVVVNDGDPDPPWRWLADIRDQRLVRLNLAGNFGPYMATAVVLNATSARYLLIQDADDWSPPGRAEQLLEKLEADGSDFAVSAQIHFVETQTGPKSDGMRWATVSERGTPGSTFMLRPWLNSRCLYRIPHHGLFKTASIRRVGGYYGGFRVSYDVMLTNLMLMTGRVSHIPQPLYYRLMRPDSLTKSPATGIKSKFREQTEAAIGVLYGRCYSLYLEYLAGRTDSSNLALAIQRSVSSNIPPEYARQLNIETSKLKAHFVETAIEPRR